MPDVTLDDPTIQCDDVGNVDFDDDRASTDDGDVLSDDDDVQGGREVIFTSVAMTRLHLMPSDVLSSFCHTIVHTATSLHTVTGLVENWRSIMLCEFNWRKYEFLHFTYTPWNKILSIVVPHND